MKLWKYHEIDKISSVFKLMLHLIWEQTMFSLSLYYQCILQGQCYVDKIKIDCIQVQVTSNVNIFRYPTTNYINWCDTMDSRLDWVEVLDVGVRLFHYPAADPMEFLADLNNEMFIRWFLQKSRLIRYREN